MGIRPKTVLVIGVHREEFAFGKDVVKELNPRSFTILSIPEGLSGKKPLPDQQFYFKARHRELYLQLYQQIRNKYRLMIDLHSGIDRAGLCADVFCRDPGLLSRVETAAIDSISPDAHPIPVRGVRLLPPRTSKGVDSSDSAIQSILKQPFGHTLIPDKVWNSHNFLYVGVEIYLQDPDHTSNTDIQFTRRLINKINAL